MQDMNSHDTRELTPEAGTLANVLRNVGYSFPVAIADLLDNSVSAGAKIIDIISPEDPKFSLVILDDGKGMSESELKKAMTYAGEASKKRSENDLGRYGLGLKTASLSLCRKLTVVSKQNGKISSSGWFLDTIEKTNRWMSEVFSADELREIPEFSQLEKKESGTLVFLSDFDVLEKKTKDMESFFNEKLVEMADHLALVFHRFISEGSLCIKLNGNVLETRDPMLHGKSKSNRIQTLDYKNNKVSIQSFVLPYDSNRTDDDKIKLKGTDNKAGIYLYRNKRLVYWGDWLGVKPRQKKELVNLVRVQLDIPNTMDDLWSINIEKNLAEVPDDFKNPLRTAVEEAAAQSEKIHKQVIVSDDGQSENTRSYIWQAHQTRDGTVFVINRNHSQVEKIRRLLVGKQNDDLEKLLSLIEKNVQNGIPVVDKKAAKKEYEEMLEAEEKFKELQEDAENMIARGRSPLSFYKAALIEEPYCNNKILRKLIAEEMKKYADK